MTAGQTHRAENAFGECDALVERYRGAIRTRGESGTQCAVRRRRGTQRITGNWADAEAVAHQLHDSSNAGGFDERKGRRRSAAE